MKDLEPQNLSSNKTEAMEDLEKGKNDENIYLGVEKNGGNGVTNLFNYTAKSSFESRIEDWKTFIANKSRSLLFDSPKRMKSGIEEDLVGNSREGTENAVNSCIVHKDNAQ